MSLISKDCMIRLGILDPSLFISENEARSFSVNTVEEKNENLSECEKTWTKKSDGSVECKCPKRAKPATYDKKHFENIFDELEVSVKQRGGVLSEFLRVYLKKAFNASSTNLCQTQALPMMLVDKMTVELK